jgi:hypothetical protein
MVRTARSGDQPRQCAHPRQQHIALPQPRTASTKIVSAGPIVVVYVSQRRADALILSPRPRPPGPGRAPSRDRSDPGEGQPPERPVIFLALRGEVDLDPGRAAVVGEAWVPALEVAGQVVVQDGGTDLEEELGARW